MHGGFGGGGGGGGHSGGYGGGHSGGYGGHSGGHSSGHSSGAHHHGGELNPNSMNSHDLGGSSQSVLGHIAGIGQNPQGIIGHIASWLTGQHQVTHHAAGATGQSQHMGDQSWTSAALQAERSISWKQRLVKMPAIQIMAIFMVIAGWLFFLGMLRHGDAEHVSKAPSATQREQSQRDQSEWRQQLTGSGASAFGMPRDVEGAVPPDLSHYVPQAYVGNSTFVPAASQTATNGNSSYGAAGAPAMSAYAPSTAAAPAPTAQIGRRSFSARAAMSAPQEAQPASGTMAGDLYAPIESRRSFHHRVIAER